MPDRDPLDQLDRLSETAQVHRMATAIQHARATDRRDDLSRRARLAAESGAPAAGSGEGHPGGRRLGVLRLSAVRPKTGKFDSQAAPRAPAWMLDPVGIDFWHNVTALNMSFHEEQGNAGITRTGGEHCSSIGPPAAPAFFGSHRACGRRRRPATRRPAQTIGSAAVLGCSGHHRRWRDPVSRHASPSVSRHELIGGGRSRSRRLREKLRGLEHLTLQGNNLTDEGLASLAGHPP